MENKNPMDFFDFSEEEAEEALKNVEQVSGRKDGRVCICGHSNGRHEILNGMVACQPAKQYCPCKKIRLVVESSNTRPFLRKTAGGGPMHALSQGIKSAIGYGYSVDWLIEPKCDKCGEDKQVSPVPVTQNGRETEEATGFDVLLCRECRIG